VPPALEIHQKSLSLYSAQQRLSSAGALAV
jgi:hypothetical protein